MTTYYGKRALEILQEEGPVELVKSSSLFLRKMMKSVLLRAKVHYHKYASAIGASPNPYKLICADPKDVNWYLLRSGQTDYDIEQAKPTELHDTYQTEKGRFDRRKNLGRILGGPWDKNKKEWEHYELFRSLKAVYCRGEEWEETEYIKNVLTRIERGYSSKGYTTKDSYINNRPCEVDRIYQYIQHYGYKPQNQITDGRNILHEVAVNIGRNGELIFNNSSGQHRLCIAKILDIDKIPMLVVVRHKKWQELRDEIYNNGLPEGRKDLCDHPDLQDILD